MVVEISLSLWWILLSVSILRPAACEEQKNITAEYGQDVTLTCRATNKNPIIVLEWTRADLDKEYVLLYRDKQFDASKQKSSFMNRVQLQDRQMKDGDVSLILKNVTSADAGRYECRVFRRGTNRRKRALLKTHPISIITLSVSDPPGQRGSVGLIAAVAVLAVVAAAAGFVIYRKRSRNQSQALSQPSSVEFLPVETV